MIWKEAPHRIAWNEVPLSDDLERSVTSDRLQKSPSLMIWKEASRRIAWNEVALSDDLERSVTSDRLE
jgi:hypothetical protein